jgi:UPF0755 protein
VTGTDRRDGGRRLVPMATVAVRPGTGRGEQERAGDGRGPAVPRRARGLRRPPGEQERATTAGERGTASNGTTEHEDAVTDTLRRDDAVTDTLHHAGTETGLPTTPSRIPLPEPARRSSPREGREVRQSDGRQQGNGRSGPARSDRRPTDVRQSDGRRPDASRPESRQPDARPTGARQPDSRQGDPRQRDGRQSDGRQPDARQRDGRQSDDRQPDRRQSESHGPAAAGSEPTAPAPVRASSSRDASSSEPASREPSSSGAGPAPTTPTSSARVAPEPPHPSSSGPDPDDDGDDALGGLVPLGSGEHAPAAEDTRRRRRLVWPAVAGVLVIGLIGGAFFARDLWGVFFPPDFAGPASGHVVVQVADGDSTRDIGETLVADGVVASARGFGDAAEDDPRGRGIQPGFYDMQHGMPAAAAVTRMLDPANRLGRLEVRGGTQLDDTAGVGPARVPGVLSLISQATCVVADSGQRRCTSVDDLRRTMATTDPAQLGVPDWALADVRKAAPERRLEGLVAPGTYDVTPGTDARTVLSSVVRTSTGRLESAGLVSGAAANNVSPYQALVVGSLAEREGVEQDFGKIARVVYNRLPIPMRLQLDSTINYPLDRQTLLTTPADRAAPGPYNTYVNFGLPPTPIGAVSAPALQAALTPDPGGWIYFVKCEPDGASCFAVSPAEHDANRRLAQARGVY